MRTIKFRGKNILSAEWVYGGITAMKDGWCSAITTLTEDEFDSQELVYSETISQFTGLVDKNGREIYEGDYVEVQQSGFGGVITWHSHGYFYIKELCKFKYNEESDCISLGEFIDNPKRKVTIVGNIYDNPELINKRKAMKGK